MNIVTMMKRERLSADLTYVYVHYPIKSQSAYDVRKISSLNVCFWWCIVGLDKLHIPSLLIRNSYCPIMA